MDRKEQISTTSSLHNSQLQLGRSTVMTRYLTFLFAIACGVAVANIYFAHPLLTAISDEFKIQHSIIGTVISITQICYALGLVFLVPHGDLINPRKLIIVQMLLLVLALFFIGISPTSTFLFIGMALVGFLATVTQTLVAFASTLSNPTERGRILGIVTSGVVIGILLARTFAGVLTDFSGWRSVYLTAAAILFLIICLLYRILPNYRNRQSHLSYPHLLHSVLLLFLQERILWIRGILGFFIFTSFSILWTSLVLPLSAAPYHLSHTAIGAFGIAGVAGALAAMKAGNLADKGKGQRTTAIALFLLLISWIPISMINYSLFLLVIGVILLDLAVQAIHVTNQSIIFTVRPEARSRLTAAYMIFYSIGSASGAIFSTYVYAKYGWNGVCILGATISGIALLFWAITFFKAYHEKGI